MNEATRKPTIAFTNFWPGFEPRSFFPAFVQSFFDLAQGEADVVVFSCFTGRKIDVPHIPPGKYVRVFYTGENVRPDFSGCDFAMTFSHDEDPARHVRIPNYVSRLAQQGIDLMPFLKARTDAEVDALVASKRAFCAYIQKKGVPIREQFVRALGGYKHVDCLGPHLNNAGFLLPMDEKHTRLRDYKFTVAFENSSSPGYVTEKAIDAYVGGSVPLYWGDPQVGRMLNPASMLVMQGDSGSIDEFVRRVADVDRDEDVYRALLKEPLFKPEALADHLDGSALRTFFAAVAKSVPRFMRRDGPVWTATATGPAAARESMPATAHRVTRRADITEEVGHGAMYAPPVRKDGILYKGVLSCNGPEVLKYIDRDLWVVLHLDHHARPAPAAPYADMVQIDPFFDSSAGDRPRVHATNRDFVDPAFFRPLGVAKTYDVVFNSAWVALKRHRLFMDGLVHAKQQGRPLRAMMMGYHWEGYTSMDIERQARETIATHGLDVDIMEPVWDWDEVNMRYNLCRCAVHTSAREAGPKILPEAALAGLPYLTTSDTYGGSPAYVSLENGNGLTFAPTPAAMAEAIWWTLDHLDSFRPRAWALENMCKPVGEKRLRAALTALESRLGCRINIDGLEGTVDMFFDKVFEAQNALGSDLNRT